MVGEQKAVAEEEKVALDKLDDKSQGKVDNLIKETSSDSDMEPEYHEDPKPKNDDNKKKKVLDVNNELVEDSGYLSGIGLSDEEDEIIEYKGDEDAAAKAEEAAFGSGDDEPA